MRRVTQSYADSVRPARGRALAPAVFLGMSVCWLAAARADHIDVALVDEAPKVMDYLQKAGYKNVGILPFEVRKGKKLLKTFDTTLSANLPTRLETALTLLEKADKPIGILHDAGKIALSHDRKANYLSAAGRRTLFSLRYSSAYSDKKELAGAFLAGEVSLSSDNKEAKVVIVAFDNRGTQPKTVSSFKVKTDRSILGDSGQSFRVASRRAGKRDADLDADAAASATAQGSGTSGSHVATDASGSQGATSGTDAGGTASTDNPVTLSILFDGQSQSTGPDPANPGSRSVRLTHPHRRAAGSSPTAITSPNAGQAVELDIQNTSSSDTLGVVLKVNGQNTLFQETDDAANCHKWILEPGKKYSIRGYYTDDTGSNLVPFKVLSDNDSQQAAGEIKDNDNLGLIEMHVFRAGASDSMDVSRKVSLRGLSPRELQKNRPRSVGEYQARLVKSTAIKPRGSGLTVDKVALMKKAPTRSVRQDRGLIVGDDNKTAGGNLVRKDFSSAQEVSNQVIRYYTVQNAASPSDSQAQNK